MNQNLGHSLLELLIAMALSVILFLVIDTVYSGLWLTRATLNNAHDVYRLRRIPEQLFADLLYHAGHLGCRAVGEDFAIAFPANLPESFFIHQGQAVKTDGDTLWVHETLNHQLTLYDNLNVGEILAPPSLVGISDWLLVSDCMGAELVSHGGALRQAYHAPVTVSPVLVTRWYIKDDTLYRQPFYPLASSVPVASGVKAMQWMQQGALLYLTWEVGQIKTDFTFELGNAA